MSEQLPAGYTPHDGETCPVDPETFVDCVIRTAQGLGHSGVHRATHHDWDSANHPDGIGAVVGYRQMPLAHGRTIDRHKRWPGDPLPEAQAEPAGEPEEEPGQ